MPWQRSARARASAVDLGAGRASIAAIRAREGERLAGRIAALPKADSAR